MKAYNEYKKSTNAKKKQLNIETEPATEYFKEHE